MYLRTLLLLILPSLAPCFFHADPYPIETIETNLYSATGNPGANALNADPAKTVFCSTAPGFTPNTFNASNPNYAAGSTNMSDCIGASFGQRLPTYTAKVQPFSFSFNVSNNSTFIVVVSATLFTDGNVYTDDLGNTYFLASNITGTRTITYTATNVSVTSIILSVNYASTTVSNRFYPFYPFFDLAGFSVNVYPPAPSAGNIRTTSSTYGWMVYRSTTIEELFGSPYPILATQFANFTNTVVPPIPFSIPRTVASAYLCVLLYSLPGNIDYPWSSAVSLSVTYNTQAYTTTAGRTYVPILSGSGSRTYTNRFGDVLVTPVTVIGNGNEATNLLYLNNTLPFDVNGLTLNFSSPVQLPGYGPSYIVTQVTLNNQSGVVLEGNETRVDPFGSAFLSNIPGFLNVTIGASNFNALAPNYPTCQAPITFTSGLRTFTEPTSSNGGPIISYSYFISDGRTYSVQGNLTLTAASGFASTQDQLGNPYQTIVNATGTRLYTYLVDGSTLASRVTGLSTAGRPGADQRFYPYALLSSAPSVYTLSTAPFFDFNGVEFAISPAAPVNGLPIGSGTQYSATELYFTTPEPTAVLTEGYYATMPLTTLQQQYYSFRNSL